MLKAPIRKIGGFGRFVRWSEMSAADAWVKYGSGNGVQSQNELVTKLERYAEKRSKHCIKTGNPIIGCIELFDIFVLDAPRFVTAEECGHSFSIKIVGLKYFDEPDRIAARLD